MDGTLGLPYRLVYQAKDNRTGLTDVKANIIKPDDSTLGPISMAEFGPATHKGFYFVDLITTGSDPEGEWIGTFDSPTEPHNTGFRIGFRKAITEGNSFFFGTESLRAQVSQNKLEATLKEDPNKLTAEVLDNEKLEGKITENKLTATVTDDTSVSGQINDDSLSGELKGDC